MISTATFFDAVLLVYYLLDLQSLLPPFDFWDLITIVFRNQSLTQKKQCHIIDIAFILEAIVIRY